MTPVGILNFKNALSGWPSFRDFSEVLKRLDFGYLHTIIYRPEPEAHLKHLEWVFQRLQEAGLKIRKSSCHFFQVHLQCLGNLVAEVGIEPLPKKLELKNVTSQNLEEVKLFLGQLL